MSNVELNRNQKCKQCKIKYKYTECIPDCILIIHMKHMCSHKLGCATLVQYLFYALIEVALDINICSTTKHKCKYVSGLGLCSL